MRNRELWLACVTGLLILLPPGRGNSPTFIGRLSAAEPGGGETRDGEPRPLAEQTALLNEAIRDGAAKHVEFLADCLLDDREIDSEALNQQALEVWEHRTCPVTFVSKGRRKEEPICIARLAEGALFLIPRESNVCLLNRVRAFNVKSRVKGDEPWSLDEWEVLQDNVGLLISLHERRLFSKVAELNQKRPENERIPEFAVRLEWEASKKHLEASGLTSIWGTGAFGRWVYGIDPALRAMAENDRRSPEEKRKAIYLTRRNLMKFVEAVAASDLPESDREAASDN